MCVCQRLLCALDMGSTCVVHVGLPFQLSFLNSRNDWTGMQVVFPPSRGSSMASR